MKTTLKALSPFKNLSLLLALTAVPALAAPTSLATGTGTTRLAHGEVRYELAGPRQGELVVLVHGVSGPMSVWDELVPRLHRAGYRSLRFDLYGRGGSARIDRAHDLELYQSQIAELTRRVGVDTFHLVGHSMGAIVSTAFASAQPGAIRSLALVGPAGFELEASPLKRLLRAPCLGEIIMNSCGKRMLANHHRAYFVQPERFGSHQERFEAQLRVPGSTAAILSTYREVPLNDFGPGYARWKGATLVLWGTADRTFPYLHHHDFLRAQPQAQIVAIPEAAHLPQLEQPDAVARPLIDYLAKADANLKM